MHVYESRPSPTLALDVMIRVGMRAHLYCKLSRDCRTGSWWFWTTYTQDLVKLTIEQVARTSVKRTRLSMLFRLSAILVFCAAVAQARRPNATLFVRAAAVRGDLSIDVDSISALKPYTPRPITQAKLKSGSVRRAAPAKGIALRGGGGGKNVRATNAQLFDSFFQASM